MQISSTASERGGEQSGWAVAGVELAVALASGQGIWR